MPSKARLKILKICKKKHAFCVNKYSQKYFPCVSKTFPVLQQNSLCFPCLEKVRTKFPVFPVPWPPCFSFFVGKHSLILFTYPWVMINNVLKMLNPDGKREQLRLEEAPEKRQTSESNN